MRKVLVLLVALTFAIQPQAFSQSYQSTGTDFWIGFMMNLPNRSDHYTRIYISSEYNTSGQVEVPQAGWSSSFTVSSNSTTTVSIPPNTVEVLTSEMVEGKGVHITSNDSISVYAKNEAFRTTDATNILPTRLLGSEYRITSWRGNGGGDHSEFLIVGVEDNTYIEINPTAQTEQGKPAGVPFTIKLNAGEVYQVQDYNANQDLTGTTVRAIDTMGACKQIAVFSGNQFTNTKTYGSSCGANDHFWHQLQPLNQWRQSYVTVPFLDKSRYYVRVLADKNNTTVVFNNNHNVSLQAGEYYDTSFVDAGIIESDKPIAAIQLPPGGTCDNGTGDPCMLRLNSDEQKIDTINFNLFSTPQINQYYTNVIVETPFVNQVQLNGNSISGSFNQVPSNPAFSYAQLSLNQGDYQLTADSGLIGYAYGFGYIESYTFSVGASFDQVNSSASGGYRDTTVCYNDTIQLNTIHSGNSYNWSPGKELNDSTVAKPITVVQDTTLYTVEVNSQCYTLIDSIMVYPQPNPAVSITGVDSICRGDTAFLTANGGLDYLWSTGDSSQQINVTPNNTTSYFVEGTHSNGCSARDSFRVNVTTIKNVSAGQDTSICEGDSVQINATDGFQYSYSWSPSSSLSNDSVSNPIAFPDSNVTYKVIVQDTQQCKAFDSVNISLLQSPSLSIKDEEWLCKGDSIQLTPSLMNVDSVYWQPDSGIGNPSSPKPYLTPKDSTVYQLSAFNDCASVQDSVLVGVNTAPKINITGTDTICQGQSTVFTANTNGNGDITWSTGQTGDSITVTTNQDTSLFVEVVSDSGCRADDQFHVTTKQSAALNISDDTSICEGNSFTVQSLNDNFQNWNTGDSGQNLTISPTADTSIYLVGTDICKNYGDTVSISVDSIPIIEGAPDTTVEKGATVELRAEAGTPSYWDVMSGSPISCNKCKNPMISPEEKSKVVVNSQNESCKAQDTVIIKTENKSCQNIVGVPTAFTPNDDGVNDRFKILGEKSEIEVKELFIYNRFGEKVYDYFEDGPIWDGSHNQRQQEVETYIYHFEYECDNSTIEQTGNVSLIR